MKVTGETRRLNGPCSITIEVQDLHDLDKVKSGVLGVRWIAGTGDGRVDTREIYEPVTLVPDPVVAPHFTPVAQVSFTPYLHSVRQSGEGPFDPGIYVQSIAGYHGDYATVAEVLESAGFECMRSRRSPVGYYWEFWYLAGTWRARGPIAGLSHDQICAWLRTEVRPGVIEVAGERWGLGLAD